MSSGYQIDVYPWTAGALGGRPVELLPTTEGVPIERVAALRPTLIAATTYYQLDPVRAELEKIAPVIGPSSQVDKETWQQSTVRVGEAVGRADEARRVVADVERVVADARAAHPQWQGRTFTFGPVIPGQDLYTVNSTSDASAALLSALGLQLAPAVTRLPNAGLPGRAKVSQEQMGLFDADALLLAHFGGDAARAEFEKQGVFRSVPAVQRGSYIPLDPALAIALAFPSVLNIPYAVREIAPLLDRALA
nr:ABC transporter substrate-binding protein [Pseudonocardia sp. C8]